MFAKVELPDDWKRGDCDYCPFNVVENLWDFSYDGFYSYCCLGKNINSKGGYVDCQLEVEED